MRLSSFVYGVGLIAFSTYFLACFGGADFLDMISTFEALIMPPARLLLSIWASFFDFSFFSLESLLLSDYLYLSGIYIPSNVGFISKSKREMVILISSIQLYIICLDFFIFPFSGQTPAPTDV